MITGGVLDAVKKGEPGVLKMDPAIIRAACDQAHALGLKVAAHVESPEGVKAALENGVDTIEHGAMPDAEMLELFRTHGASLVTTISPPFLLPCSISPSAMPRICRSITDASSWMALWAAPRPAWRPGSP